MSKKTIKNVAKNNVKAVEPVSQAPKVLTDYLGDLPEKATDYTTKEQLVALKTAFEAAQKDDNKAVMAELRAIGVKAVAHLKALTNPPAVKKEKIVTVKAVPQLDRKMLIELAKEAVKVMALQNADGKPFKVTKDLTDAALQERLIAELKDIRADDVVSVAGQDKDVFSLTALDTIVKLGLTYPGAPKAEKKARASGPRGARGSLDTCAKAVVYRAWAGAKGKATIEALIKESDGKVKGGTVRGWVSAWGRGQNLPAIAKKG